MKQNYLMSILKYDCETGKFTWIRPPLNHPRLYMKEAGCNSTGYILIRIDGRKYKAHRLAWLYVYGEFPKSDIDHKDGNPENNKIENLRLATNSQNQANAKRMAGKKIPKGVRIMGSRYQARITFEGKMKYLGTFGTPEAASEAYGIAADRLYGEFGRES